MRRSRSGPTIPEADRRARGSTQVKLRLPIDVAALLADMARERGVSMSALLVEWILSRSRGDGAGR